MWKRAKAPTSSSSSYTEDATEVVEELNQETFETLLNNTEEIYVQQSSIESYIANTTEPSNVADLTPTDTFNPINITEQIQRVWSDLDRRRKWVLPAFITISIVFVLTISTNTYINYRNSQEAVVEEAVVVTNNSNELVALLPDLIEISTNTFYSKYDVSNASANLQIIETSLIQYQTDIIDREIPNRSNVEASLNQLFNIVEKLDQLFTYRIIHSEILIYEVILNIDEDTVIDDLANELSLIGAKSNLNGDTLPNIEEFTDQEQLVISALATAQDLHGRLVASLRNNEVEVANTLISAIQLNKESEISFFNDSLLDFQEKYRSILENIEKLP